MPHRAVPGIAPRRMPTDHAASASKPAASRDPVPLRCLQCGTTWYSRVAALIVESGMGCARCGAPLGILESDD